MHKHLVALPGRQAAEHLRGGGREMVSISWVEGRTGGAARMPLMPGGGKPYDTDQGTSHQAGRIRARTHHSAFGRIGRAANMSAPQDARRGEAACAVTAATGGADSSMSSVSPIQNQQLWLQALVTHKEWLDGRRDVSPVEAPRPISPVSPNSVATPVSLVSSPLKTIFSKVRQKASTSFQKRPSADALTADCSRVAMRTEHRLPPRSDWLTSLEWLMMEHKGSGMSHVDFFHNQEKACERLQALCAPAGSEQDASDAGVVEAAIASMRAHPQAAGVQQQGCVLLNYVCCGTDEEEDPARLAARSQRAAEAGGIEAVVAAMRAHALVAEVQEEGATVLCNMCYGRDAAGLARAQRAVEAGALEAVVAAIWACPHEPEVAVVCCGLLHNVCYGTDAAGLARLRRAAEAGALEAVLAAMRAHPEVVDVQAEGCIALINVCHHAGAPERAVEAGVLEAMVAMMQRHLNAADLQRLGCMALCRVCAATCRVSGPAARARVRLAIEAGGREVVWLAMQAHPAHEELQRRGQRVLDCLLDLPAAPADGGVRPV